MPSENSTYHHGDLRAALLTEAATMITEGGADAVTMRSIGERVGVSRAAAYRHFADKAALLVAVASAGFERLRDRLAEAALDQSATGTDRLRRLGEEYVRFALDNPAHYRLMYGREALTRSSQPELQESANALFEDFVATIEAHQAAGALKSEDARGQAYVAWSAVHGLASLLIEGQIRPDVDVDALIVQTTSTLLEGMGA